MVPTIQQMDEHTVGKETPGEKLTWTLCQMAPGPPFSVLDVACDYRIVILGSVQNSSLWTKVRYPDYVQYDTHLDSRSKARI